MVAEEVAKEDEKTVVRAAAHEAGKGGGRAGYWGSGGEGGGGEGGGGEGGGAGGRRRGG